jgi:hypothetical protein
MNNAEHSKKRTHSQSFIYNQLENGAKVLFSSNRQSGSNGRPFIVDSTNQSVAIPFTPQISDLFLSPDQQMAKKLWVLDELSTSDDSEPETTSNVQKKKKKNTQASYFLFAFFSCLKLQEKLSQKEWALGLTLEDGKTKLFLPDGDKFQCQLCLKSRRSDSSPRKGVLAASNSPTTFRSHAEKHGFVFLKDEKADAPMIQTALPFKPREGELTLIEKLAIAWSDNALSLSLVSSPSFRECFPSLVGINPTNLRKTILDLGHKCSENVKESLKNQMRCAAHCFLLLLLTFQNSRV